MDQYDRVVRVFLECDSQVWHRNGTKNDHQSARWLAGKVGEREFDVELEALGRPGTTPGTATLRWTAGKSTDYHRFDGTFTGPQGMQGRMGCVSPPAKIVLSEVKRSGCGNDAVQAAREFAGHRVLVAVTVGQGPGLLAMSPVAFWEPFGPPVLQVDSEVQAQLSVHAERGSDAHLVASVTGTEAESFNVVGRLKGTHERLHPLIVMTPHTGWWDCASERGGCLAFWLEVMHTLGEAGSRRDVIFVATSAHEPGLHGFDAFLERSTGLVEDVSAWVHFGANIGAAQGPWVRSTTTDDELERLTKSALEEAGTNPAEAVPRSTTAGAESQVVARRSGRVPPWSGATLCFT